MATLRAGVVTGASTRAEPGPAGLPVTPPPRSSLAVLRGLMPFLRPYGWRVAAAGIALLVASVATLAIPVAFRQLIDVGFATRALQSEVTRAGGHVDAWFLGLFGVATVLALGTAVRFYFVSWLGERVTADLRAAVYARVLRQDPIFFESLRGGEVLSRLTADTTLIQTLVGTSVSMGLRNALLFIGGLVMLLATSAKLASLIVGLLVVVILPILLFGRRVRKLSRASQDRIADSSALAGETLSAIQIVQAYAREASNRRGSARPPKRPSRPRCGAPARARHSPRWRSCWCSARSCSCSGWAPRRCCRVA
jgi:ATP-binding cassette subfamily B protein